MSEKIEALRLLCQIYINKETYSRELVGKEISKLIDFIVKNVEESND